MPRVNVELNIPRESVEQPIVWRLGKLFNVVTNVRQARVSSEYGVVSLDIEGSTAEVEQAVAYLKGIGVVEGESSTTSPTPPESGEITPNSIAVRLRTVNPLQATAPILCRVARDYRVVVNICYAALDQEEGGTLDIILSGALLEVQRSIAYLHTTGLSVSPRERSVSDKGNL